MSESPLQHPAYRIDGDGPWLTLLHGFSQDLQVWDAAVALLSANFRLLRIDLRGHGASANHPGPFRPHDYLADVLAVLDAEGIAATHLWGTHTGAGVALLMAAEHPGRVGGLVLEGAVIPGEALASVDGWHAASRATLQREGREAALRDWWEQAPFFAHPRRLTQEEGRSDMREIVLRFSAAPWQAPPASDDLPTPDALLGSVRAPTLIVNGDEDLPEFQSVARRLERSLPGARRVVLPGVGAFPGWEAPATVVPVVAGFLRDVD